ncbi:MAG: hypothetical protein JWN44_663 [Myxococcales bacterium]|nr:hypothetical protein [Myxococcales bacterium]
MHTANADVLLPRSPSMVPWMLFVVAVVAGLGLMFVQKQKFDMMSARTTAAAETERSMHVQLAEAASHQHALEVKVQELETENARLKTKVASVASAHIAAPADESESKASKKKSARKHHKRH